MINMLIMENGNNKLGDVYLIYVSALADNQQILVSNVKCCVPTLILWNAAEMLKKKNK